MGQNQHHLIKKLRVWFQPQDASTLKLIEVNKGLIPINHIFMVGKLPFLLYLLSFLESVQKAMILWYYLSLENRPLYYFLKMNVSHIDAQKMQMKVSKTH